MEARLFCFLLALQMASWSYATSRSLAPNEPGSGQRPESLQVPLGQTMKEVGLGSTPPSCEHKCYGCMPCEAIQVPAAATTTTSKRGHEGLQDANCYGTQTRNRC
ncbi:hypothetical protein HRI_000972200 [Hibiscus trionum]|uniref:Epidermal patterning factor-like protein n=1 Tax=Hibiscus trionum TaxID=183268 RepID=A0A9W7H8Q6_HIBTR|nr:hypothetical protein HRI_000972200 [Hibiscus trionum]